MKPGTSRDSIIRFYHGDRTRPNGLRAEPAYPAIAHRPALPKSPGPNPSGTEPSPVRPRRTLQLPEKTGANPQRPKLGAERVNSASRSPADPRPQSSSGACRVWRTVPPRFARPDRLRRLPGTTRHPVRNCGATSGCAGAVGLACGTRQPIRRSGCGADGCAGPAAAHRARSAQVPAG